MNKKALSLLSLCARAGKLITGEVGCEKSLQAGTVKLIIISSDASDNTKKKFINKAFYYKVPAVTWGTREELSSAVGKQNRTSFAITDGNFASSLIKLTESENIVEMEENGWQN